MNERPLIGVTTSEVRLAERMPETPQGEPPRREMALGLIYLQAIEAAGGLPVVIPPLEPAAIEPLLSRLAGICLSGGPDLDPATYDARPHPQLGPTEPDLDRFELALARRVWAMDLPVLGICRGAQALNVAAGGTLHQHLPGPPETLRHRQVERAEEATHAVRVEAGTLLAALTGRRSCPVNSFHHQAASRLGHRLRAVAWAEDGVVEAIEAPDHVFALGVQWHAESMTDRPEQARLFEALVEAAAGGATLRRLRAA